MSYQPTRNTVLPVLYSSRCCWFTKKKLISFRIEKRSRALLDHQVVPGAVTTALLDAAAEADLVVVMPVLHPLAVHVKSSSITFVSQYPLASMFKVSPLTLLYLATLYCWLARPQRPVPSSWYVPTWNSCGKHDTPCRLEPSIDDLCSQLNKVPLFAQMSILVMMVAPRDQESLPSRVPKMPVTQ